MQIMNGKLGEGIDSYYGEYKSSIFSKKTTIRLRIYPSHIEGDGFAFYDNELSSAAYSFEISHDDIEKVYIGEVGKEAALFIKHNFKSVVDNKKAILVLPGMADAKKWLSILEETRKAFIEKKQKQQQIKVKKEEEQRRLAVEKERQALQFYQRCYSFHIKDSTPIYQLFSGKNKIALIYIDEKKSLNFLKIDGYAHEENNGVITYKNIHYYEKAGNVSYVTDIHGNYSSFGGSMTGGKFSKLAAVGGGALFGVMGMALGAALTYKPAEQKATNTSFSIGSDIKKIDDRSVMLNFYSEMKKQYVDIELPRDIYNFLQTYLPEKKFGIVDELEKKTIVHQSDDIIKNGSLLKTDMRSDLSSIEQKGIQETDAMEDFKLKVGKLKMMKDAGLLSDEKFAEEQEKLLNMI